jgi:hypothetical protein
VLVRRTTMREEQRTLRSEPIHEPRIHGDTR